MPRIRTTSPNYQGNGTAISIKEYVDTLIKWLQTYIERIFDEREKALQLAFKAQQEALSVATKALDKELDHLNRLRQEVVLDRAEFITNDKFDAVLEPLKATRNQLLGFAAALGTISGIVSAVVTTYAILHR